MNFKRFHESKNLLDLNALIQAPSGTFSTFDGTETFTAEHLLEIQLKPNTYYRMSSNYVKTGTKSNIIYLQYADSSKATTSTVSPSYRTDNTGVVKVAMYTSRYGAEDFISGSAWVMLNEGDTPQPYEPYSSEVWHDIPHYIHNISTDTITTLPADIYVNDTTATLGLKGQMSQSSQPSPTTPIQPSECGERTGNLFNLSAYSSAVLTNCTIAINDDILTQTNSGTIAWSAWKIDNLQVGADYTMSVTINNPDKTECQIRIYDSTNSTVITSSTPSKATSTTLSATFTAQTTIHYVRLYSNTSSTTANTYSVEFSEIMLNSGETALPYEPFGVKIPILSNSTTTPVYLGETQSTRRIKKYEFTGTESGYEYSAAYRQAVALYVADVVGGAGATLINALCTHYVRDTRNNLYNNTAKGFSNSAEGGRIIFFDTNYQTLESFKAFLKDQYDAGTPVTVWYVLATEETGIVNEPIRKIGTYADEVSGISIPTIAGANTLSIGTTLQPSEVTVNYKGWHPVQSVHEYDSNYTIATMQALTIAQLQTHTISDLQGGEWS